TGFWRPRPNNHIEMQLVHPTGYAEIWYGTLTVTGMENATIIGARVELRTDMVARTESAKEYVDGHRLYGLVEGRLLWTFDMAAVGQSITNHLAATLNRVDGS
ncbi:MAG: FABP family protein, partial [Actinomycetales bacterium]